MKGLLGIPRYKMKTYMHLGKVEREFSPQSKFGRTRERVKSQKCA